MQWLRDNSHQWLVVDVFGRVKRGDVLMKTLCSEYDSKKLLQYLDVVSALALTPANPRFSGENGL